MAWAPSLFTIVAGLVDLRAFDANVLLRALENESDDMAAYVTGLVYRQPELVDGPPRGSTTRGVLGTSASRRGS